MQTPKDGDGHWSGLDSPTQVPRYSAIAEMLCGPRGSGSFLDVGCGEGVLRSWLPKDVSYTGIEPSAAAVRTALRRDPSVRIIHARAEDFDARGELFDVIVFNEMLYYSGDPVGLLRKYAAMLRPGGVILCSVYQKPGGIPVRQRLRHLLDRRHPMSNVHCAKMLRNFMTYEAWPILEDRAVPMPGSPSQWHIWLAAPAGKPAGSRGSV